MKFKDNLIKYQLNLENVVSIVRKFPDLSQKEYIHFFADNGIKSINNFIENTDINNSVNTDEQKIVSTSKLCRFFNLNNIASMNNILISENTNSNRAIFMWKEDFQYQMNFFAFGNYITNNIEKLHPIMIFNYKTNSKTDLKSIYSLTIILTSNNSNDFFEYISEFENLFNFNIFSNSIGYRCITLNFKSKSSAIHFKNLLNLLKEKKYLHLTIFECMVKCKINTIN